MQLSTLQSRHNGQTAIEYMLLLAIVVAIVLVGFRHYIPRSRYETERSFNMMSIGILGAPPVCNKLLDPGDCP
ncbi:MAG: hypothetical protein A2787_09380 [Omnitrophica WOR_2 bacterium RIFCSPHIGHO2_01_FULL_48_9]|nr:MAG: hypothetical protein A2787_09380 [Omnitrophica WOR_2 bacterium RIFCSPHIGHO2_01_FULL_48_9]